MSAQAPPAPKPADGASLQPPIPGEACPLCGAPLAADQEWCLRCGAAARTRLAATPNWRAPIAALAVVVALALGVLIVALVKLAGDSGPAPAPITRTVTTPAATPPATSTPAPGATTPGAAHHSRREHDPGREHGRRHHARRDDRADDPRREHRPGRDARRRARRAPPARAAARPRPNESPAAK